MPSRTPPEPQPVDAHSAEHCYILRRLNGKDPMISVRAPLILEIVDDHYAIKLAAQNQGGAMKWPWSTEGRIYDKTKTGYVDGYTVYVLPTDPICTTSVTDPDTGADVKSLPGVWLCVQDAPPVVNPPGLPAGTYPRIPFVPLANDDPTSGEVYWIPIALVTNC